MGLRDDAPRRCDPWLTGIVVIGPAFDGFYQTRHYVFDLERDGARAREPVRHQRVRSLITEPTGEEDLPAGDMATSGLAWSGAAPIERVEVSIDDGAWRTARLIGERKDHCWQRWELLPHIHGPGQTTVWVRAPDIAGSTQPSCPNGTDSATAAAAFKW